MFCGLFITVGYKVNTGAKYNLGWYNESYSLTTSFIIDAVKSAIFSFTFVGEGLERSRRTLYALWKLLLFVLLRLCQITELQTTGGRLTLKLALSDRPQCSMMPHVVEPFSFVNNRIHYFFQSFCASAVR